MNDTPTTTATAARRRLLRALFAGTLVLGATALAPAQEAAAPVDATATAQDDDADATRFDGLLQAVQTDPGGTSEPQAVELMQIGLNQGRAYAVNLAMKGYLSHHASPSPRLMLLAARAAELSGDLRTAVSRYRSLLDGADEQRDDIAGADEAAGRLHPLLIDVLDAEDEAYQLRRRHLAEHRDDPLVRRYDGWFLDEARERNDTAATAEALAAAMSADMPRERADYFYGPSLRVLLNRITRAEQDQYEALPALERLRNAVKDDDTKARIGFLITNLRHAATAAGKDDEALAKSFAGVIDAGRDYLEQAPGDATFRDVMLTLTGGYGSLDQDHVKLHREAISAFYADAFNSLDTAAQRRMLGWNPSDLRNRAVTDATWTQLALKNREALSGSDAAHAIDFEWSDGDVKQLEALAQALEGVESLDAARLRAGAAGDDAEAMAEAALENEMWHLRFDQADDLADGLLDIYHKRNPNATDEQVDAARAVLLGRLVATTPAAIFDERAVQQYLRDLFRVGLPTDEDKAKFADVMEGMTWIPYSDRKRGDGFRDLARDVQSWANAVRKRAKKDPASVSKGVLESADRVEAAVERFHNADEPSFDAAPDDLTRQMARAEAAVQARDGEAFNDAARKLLDMVSGDRATTTPYARAVRLYLAQWHAGIDSFDLKLDVLRDALTRYSVGGDNEHERAIVDAVAKGPGNWDFYRHPVEARDQIQRLNAVFEEALTRRLDDLKEGDRYPSELMNWWLGTRRGRNWRAEEWGSDLARRIIDDKLFHKVLYQRDGFESATVGYMWLIDEEFPTLAERYPLEGGFDQMFADEALATGRLDPAYWDHEGRDENKMVADAAARVLSRFERLPLGPDTDGPRYEPEVFWQWHERAKGATPEVRDEAFAKIESYYGKTRWDDYAMGEAYFSTRGDVATPEGRSEYFERLDEYLRRRAQSPLRGGLPRLTALAKVDAATLTDSELDTLMLIFPEAVPARWEGGNGYEALVTTLQRGLLARGRTADLRLASPHLWRAARGAGGDLPGQMLAFAGELVQAATGDAEHELVLVYADAGLAIAGESLPEAGRTELATIRSGALAGIGGVIPVRPSDPRYPVFASQAAYLTGRDDAAWELYQPQRARVEEMYRDLDPGYVIWLIDRHTRVAEFAQAERLAQLMLVWFDQAGASFDAQTRGRLLLAYADIALARPEYARARALFERIVAAEEFADTQAKAQAELRIAEVDRRTGRFDEAMTLLEDLAQRRDPRLQTQAFYGMALVHYDQQDFTQAMSDLEQVFRRDPEHADARLLEGRAKIELNKLEDVAEGLDVGRVTLQRQIVPGKPLKVSLEDPNLNVVAKSTDIRIRAWTDSGDEELFSLLPFGDSKTRFRGEVATQLGEAKPNDGTLQLTGDDLAHYDYAPDFKRANRIGLDAPPALSVASDATLFASSGRILSPREQEAMALEAMIRKRIGESGGGGEASEPQALSMRRVADQVKPGNAINVRVNDPDRSVSDGADTLTVRVRAASGDSVSYDLTETGPFTGVFEGAVPTDAGQALAIASDSEDGRDPNYAISSGDYPGWSGLADATSPRWFAVDLNDYVALGNMSVLADVPGQKLQRFTVEVSNNGESFTPVAAWPEAYQPWDGSPQVQVIELTEKEKPGVGRELSNFIDTHWRRAKTTPTARLAAEWNDKAVEELGAKLEGDGRYVARLRGAFVLPQRQVKTIELRDLNPSEATRYAVLVDGKPGQSPTKWEGSLAKGVHTVEVLVASGKGQTPKFGLMWDVPEEPYIAPVPAEAMDVERHPEIRDSLYIPPAEITAAQGDTSFDIAFDPAIRARVMRLLIEDFTGAAPALRRVTLTDRSGNRVLPTETDFLELRRNDQLEILPGDRITVTYRDPVVVSRGRDTHEARLSATYANGTIAAAFLETSTDAKGNRSETYVPMRRFDADDTIFVVINDPDLDATGQLDTVSFTAQTAGAQGGGGGDGGVELKALETAEHSGVFIGKVFPVEGTPQREGEIQVARGGEVVLGYRDVENTDPGIAWTREARVERVRYQDPELRVYEVTSRPLTPAEAAAEAARLAALDADAADEVVPHRFALVAARPERPQDSSAGMTRAVVGGPLPVELLFPPIAKSARSRAVLYAQAGSARDMARAAGREPQGEFDLTVPGTLRLATSPSDVSASIVPPGYLGVTLRKDPYAVEPLEDGRFGFNLPLRMGPLPDASYALDDAAGQFQKPVTTLTVRGDDTVHLGFRYTDDAGAEHWITRTIKLTSDPVFDLMERKYQQPLDALHVGQTGYLRVIDPARNTSDENDTINVDVTTTTGQTKSLELTETLSHSGVFKGLATLVYAGEDAAKDADPTTVPVTYGDDVTLAYFRPDGEARLEHTLNVFKGADGDVLPFTKRFNDDDVAVQTQFTIAESYFELAKRHRELGDESLARREILQGKKLLEEAIRDYPDTAARAQADYLLANLAMEFATEAEDESIKARQYREAVNRFSDIVASYPDSDYAPKSQYKKAQAFEKMGEIDRASEEYVKLSYRYPDHELVADTIARLGQYFLTKGRDFKQQAEATPDKVEAERLLTRSRDMFKTAAEVFGRLAVRFPDHELADKTTVLAAQCYMQASRYAEATGAFRRVINREAAQPALKAEAMYWAGDAYSRMEEYADSYEMFKRLTWEHPESKWAKYARGRLREKAYAGMD